QEKPSPEGPALAGADASALSPGSNSRLFAELIPDLHAARAATPSARAAFLFACRWAASHAIESRQVNPVGRVVAECALAGFVWIVSVPAAASESRFLAPAAGDVLASGVTHEVRWESPCLSERDGGEKEVLLSVDGGRTFPIRVTAELPACAMSFRWKI